MHFTTLKFNRSAIITAVLGLAFGMAANIYSQTTNFIPANIFLTDDGKVFWYRHGERLIDAKKIKAAQNSVESRPADQDPEGHWGQPTNGFQLSLRFEKQTFTNGESVVATMLMRNVTDKSQTYFRPIHIVATKDGKFLKRKGDLEFMQITMPPTTTLFPQTQHRYQENVNQNYDLHESGEYVFQAQCKQPKVTSQPVDILITNAVQTK